MRILQIPNYQYPHIGGIEQVSRDISDALLDCKNVEQKIICFNEDAKGGNYVCHRKETVHDQVNGVEVIRCGCVAKVASQSLSPSYPFKLRKVLKDFKPDVVVLHYPNPFVSSFLLPLLPKNTRFILWWHLDIVKQKILGKLFNGQTENLCKRADKIIATSPNYIEGSEFLSKYKDKCTVIPNCIRPERFVLNEHTEKKIAEIKEKYNGKTICFAVGRHVPYKGMGYLVKASQYLDDSFVVLIGGKGELTDSLKEEAKDDKKVVFLGRVEEADMVAYYKACDIFCFPSITKNEAFGIALAEGMYFEKPAVTFTIPGSGVNYVSLDRVTGIEVENGNVEKYAEAMKILAADKGLRDKYGIAGKKRVVNNFLDSQFRENIQQLIEMVQ